MWVFDGEQWTDEGGGEPTRSAEQKQFRIEEFLPELQVVEVVQVPQTTNHVPMYPHP
ncbi:MAG TPA: hypothetical protein VF980_08080 [Thermoanaerobaculia bacterium]